MTKKKAFVFVLIFMLVSVVPTIVNSLFGQYIVKTGNENRNMTEKPAFSLSGLKEYPGLYENYFNDALPFRTQMVKTNSIINYALLGDSTVDKVVVGREGWLFYNPAGSDADPIADYRGKNLYTEDQLKQYAEHIVKVRDELQAQGREFIVFIAPNKESIYGSEFLPARIAKSKATSITKCDQIVDYLLENTDLRIVSAEERINEAVRNNPDKIFFYKTDTHWNVLGGYVGAQLLAEELGVQLPPMEELQIITSKGNYVGDLARMLNIEEYVSKELKYDISGYKTGAQKDEGYSSVSEKLRYTCEDGDKRKLLIVRDSFAMHLLPYITPQFKESYFIHRNAYTPEYLNECDPDIVVYQMVERYLDGALRFNVK